MNTYTRSDIIGVDNKTGNVVQQLFSFILFAFVSDAVSALYESINFDRDFSRKPTTERPSTKTPVPKLRRQNALAQQQSSEPEEKQKRGKCSKSFLDGMIPPPPPSPPITFPPKDADNDDDDDIAHFGAETMEKLNKLYEIRNFLRRSNETEEDEVSDFDEVVYRIRDFKDFSRRSNRGSSKPMCSLVSVSIYKYKISYPKRIRTNEGHQHEIASCYLILHRTSKRIICPMLRTRQRKWKSKKFN